MVIAPSPPAAVGIDDASQISLPSALSPLSFPRALALARRMREELRSHTKDRKWRFKSYADCFTASHAINWALENVSAEEAMAVNRLNKLVEYGLLMHVVDHSKRFRVGETRTLYFRMASDSILDADVAIDSSPGKGTPIISGLFSSGVGAYGLNSPESVQQQLANIDHVLQETVKELNDTRGKLEMVHQEVLGLVSQQIFTFLIIFILYVLIICVVVPSSGMGWLGIVGLALTMGASTRYGWRCISLWSDLDSRTVPLETVIVADDDRSLAESTLARDPKPFERKPHTSSITSIISKSIKSMTGVSGRALMRSKRAGERPLVFMRDAYSLPDAKTWVHRPLMICANAAPCPDLKVPDYGLDACPLGVPFQFSSDLFEGTCLIRLKGSNSDNPEGDAEYFNGRKRIFQSVVQGRFKEEVPVSDVTTGHEFTRPLKNLPHPFILRTATAFIGKVSPGANIVVHTDQPFVEVTLCASSQIVRGDEPGNEPNITCKNIVEDCSIFGGVFAKGNVPASRRKRFFANSAKCKGYTFDTETVYTFEFYQNLFDAQSYSLDLGFAKIGCSSVLNGQPIQWLGKTRDGRYLWSFQIWNEKLLANRTP
ncbi:hypothetical protein ACHAXT_005554 [Thalassiosira profunda]